MRCLDCHKALLYCACSDVSRLESTEARVKELEAKLERHRGWTGLSLSHDLEKAEARIAVLESALRDIKACWENIQTPKPYYIGDRCDEALQGEASKGGNAFNTSTPVSAESTSESKALVEHAHNTSDLLAAVRQLRAAYVYLLDCNDLICECGYYDEVDEQGEAVMSTCGKCASDEAWAKLSPFLGPSPAEQEGGER